MAYLESVMPGPVQRDRLDAYLDHAPEMAHFMKSLDIPIGVAAWPDYYPHAPEARADRSLIIDTCDRSEEHTSELQSLMRISYAVFCLKKKKHNMTIQQNTDSQLIHYKFT